MTHVVRRAIHLDADLRGSAVEVEHVWANRMLAAELHPVAEPQMLPQEHLRERHGAAELASKRNVALLLGPWHFHPSVSRLWRLPPPHLAVDEMGRIFAPQPASCSNFAFNCASLNGLTT